MYDISHIYIVHYQDENNAAFFQFLWCPLCPCQALDASTDAVAPLWAQLQLILSAAAQARGTARARRGHGAGTARARHGHGGHGLCVRLCLVAAHCVHCAHRAKSRHWGPPWSPTTPTTSCSHLKSREVNESQGATAPVKVTSAFWLLLAEALGQLGRAAPWPSFPFQFS